MKKLPFRNGVRGQLALLAVPGALLAATLFWSVLTARLAEGPDLASVYVRNPDAAKLERLDRRRIAFTGKLRLVGSGRSTQLVVTSDAPQDVFLVFADRAAMEPFLPFQGRRLRAEGLLVCQRNEYPNPVYNHTRYLLYEFTLGEPRRNEEAP